MDTFVIVIEGGKRHWNASPNYICREDIALAFGHYMNGTILLKNSYIFRDLT